MSAGKFGKAGSKLQAVKVRLGFVDGELVIKFTNERGDEFELYIRLGFVGRFVDRVKDLIDGEEPGA